MTADAKAPGAAAEYLDIQDVADDSLHSRIFYARIKVLQEQGKELADVEIPLPSPQQIEKDFVTVQLPYQSSSFALGQPPQPSGNQVRISDFKARVIHADGTVIPVEGKTEDLLKRETTAQNTQRTVVHLPEVEVGSIIEYRFVERYDGLYSSPQWQVQRQYPVKKAHFTFLPYKTFLPGVENQQGSYLVDRHGVPLSFLLYWPKLPSGAELKRDSGGRFFLDVANVPATPREEWMPPNESTNYRVRFYYRSDANAKEFWVAQGKKWSKEVDRLAEPTRAIQDAVAKLTAPGDSEEAKARKLYQTVQGLENTDFTPKKSDSAGASSLPAEKRAEETWTQKSGSRQDIALLYLAMLRAAGIKAYDMKVVNRDHGVFAQDYLYFDQLEDDITLAVINGKEVVLDPGEKMCPYGTVHWKHSGAGGVRQVADASAGKAVAVSPVQAHTGNTLVRLGEVNVDEKGAIVGSFRFTIAGQEALHWRQTALREDEPSVRREFNAWLAETAPAGVKAEIDRFEGLTNPDANLIAMVTVRGSLAKGEMGGTGGKGLELPSFFFATRGHEPFVEDPQRLEQVDMRYGEQVTDQVTYHLASGMTVLNAPQDTHFAWEGHTLFAVKTKSDPGQITIARSLARAFTFARPEEYSSLRDFYQKVETADRQPLTIERAQAANGAR